MTLTTLGVASPLHELVSAQVLPGKQEECLLMQQGRADAVGLCTRYMHGWRGTPPGSVTVQPEAAVWSCSLELQPVQAALDPVHGAALWVPPMPLPGGVAGGRGPVHPLQSRALRGLGLHVQVAREIEIHAATVHPAAIKLYAAFEDAEGTYLVQVTHCCVACWMAGVWVGACAHFALSAQVIALASGLSAAGCCHLIAALLSSSWSACDDAPNVKAGIQQGPPAASCCI